LYPEKIFPEMALGIEGSRFNPRVESNRVSFKQGSAKVVSVSEEEVSGAATAPRQAVLTVRVPSLLLGLGELTVFNGYSESNALKFSDESKIQRICKGFVLEGSRAEKPAAHSNSLQQAVLQFFPNWR
jgi:hypothetical protein